MREMSSRIYQNCMRLALYAIPWRSPEIMEGAGSSATLPEVIRRNGEKKPILVTDRTLMNLGVTQALIASMEQRNMPYALYDDVSPNPSDDCVETGVNLYREQGCDCIIAFGGGSPMDCAKAIAARIARPDRRLEQLQGLFRVLRKVPTIYAVPTTAGTGSETTLAAVITCSSTHHKASINDICIMPRYAVLDPELTLGLPPRITATTGMDALCHAVEAYTNHKYNTALENDLCRKAVRLVYENLDETYRNGQNVEARQNMQRAAFYAGRAFSRGCVGYVHAIGHALGGKYGTAHGLAMSILLPHVLRQYGPAAQQRLAELSDVCSMTEASASERTKAEAFLTWIEELKIRLNIPAYLPTLETEDIPQLAAWACKEGNPLYPTPVLWQQEDFEAFLYQMKDKMQS